MKTGITLAALAVALLAACSEPMGTAAELTQPLAPSYDQSQVDDSGFGMGSGSSLNEDDGAVTTTSVSSDSTEERSGFMVGSGS